MLVARKNRSRLMKRLLIVACSATKKATSGDLPALARYDGTLYRVIRRWPREVPQTYQLTLLILSARFGLIRADTPIPNYDQRMTIRRAIELRSQVRQTLHDHLAVYGPYTATCISLGKGYWPALDLDAVQDRLGTITRTHGAIGLQAQQLKRWLWEAQ
jgi:hypothetical protein